MTIERPFLQISFLLSRGDNWVDIYPPETTSRGEIMSKVSFWWGANRLAMSIAGNVAKLTEIGLRPESNGPATRQCLTCEVELNSDGHRTISGIQSILRHTYQIYTLVEIDNVDILDLVVCQGALIKKLDLALDQAIENLFATQGRFIKGGAIAQIRANLEVARNLPLFGYQMVRHNN